MLRSKDYTALMTIGWRSAAGRFGGNPSIVLPLFSYQSWWLLPYSIFFCIAYHVTCSVRLDLDNTRYCAIYLTISPCQWYLFVLMIMCHISKDMTMIFVSCLSSLQCLWFCGIYLRTSPWQSYSFHFLVHRSGHDFGNVQWWVHFPLAVRLIWGNGFVLW